VSQILGPMTLLILSSAHKKCYEVFVAEAERFYEFPPKTMAASQLYGQMATLGKSPRVLTLLTDSTQRKFVRKSEPSMFPHKIIRFRGRKIRAGAVCGLAVLAFACLTSCNRQSSKSTAGTSDKSSNSPASTRASAPKAVNVQNPVVRIDTSAGPITVRLDGVRAPGTVRNFLNYVNERFYDNTTVHYVDPDKMIIAGGYSADRAPKQARTPIRNEAHNGLKNVRGTIAMTRDASRIDSATSQFFINLLDAPKRDHTGDTADTYGYCVFGEVTEGLDVAEKISKSPTTSLAGDLVQTPDPPVIVKSVRVVQ
jgi:cyclophilin family peptidyl-prolyl cis-trans isomerase